MKTKTTFTILLAAHLLLPAVHGQESQTAFPSAGDTVVIEGCRVDPAEDQDIPASEAGILWELHVRDGSRVEKGEELGMVDDRESRMQEKVVRYQLRQAKNKAEDTIDQEYSIAAHKVAEKSVERLELANKLKPSAFTEVEVEKAELEAIRAELAIKKAVNDRKLAHDEYWSKRAEHEAAEMAIERRKIFAPDQGEVVKLYRRQGEWVNPGDPVLRLVQLDTLHVFGNLDIERYDPRDVLGCEVDIEIMTGGGRSTQTTGKITWVSPITLATGGFTTEDSIGYTREIKAEIDNQWDGEHWSIYPGVQATMTIQLGSAARVSQKQ